MSEFIKTLLSLSVAGTLLLLLIMGLKPLYKNRFSRRWQYYIWIIAALRFLLPFTPETTPVGWLFEQIPTAAIAGEDRVDSGDPLTWHGFGETDRAQADQNGVAAPAELAPAEPTSADPAAAGPTSAEPVSAALHLPEMYVCLFFIWLAAALALFTRKVTMYQGFLRHLKAGNTEVSDPNVRKLLSNCRERLGIKTGVRLFHNEVIGSPIMTGFFRPSIILPAEELEGRELFYIFEHELHHYKQRDMFYKWLIQIVVCAHWFNPFAYLLEKEVNRACELACDEAVIAGLDDHARHEYGDTLLLFSKEEKRFQNTLASVTMSEGAEHLKERLGAIMNFKKKSKMIVAVSLMAALMLAVGGLAVGAYAAQQKGNYPEEPANGAVGSDEEDPDSADLQDADTAGEEESSGTTEPDIADPQDADAAGKEKVYVPVWMQPYSVTIYDGDLNCTIVQGGVTTAEEVAERDGCPVAEIEPFFEDHSELAKPYTKVEYDLHGFLQNVYFRVPGTTDEYQLEDPSDYGKYFVGKFYDDMGSQLVISQIDYKNYTIEIFDIYQPRLARVEHVSGTYDVYSGVLSFSGIDDMGNAMSAEIVRERHGNTLFLTLTDSAYTDCPAGTVFELRPDESNPYLLPPLNP